MNICNLILITNLHIFPDQILMIHGEIALFFVETSSKCQPKSRKLPQNHPKSRNISGSHRSTICLPGSKLLASSSIAMASARSAAQSSGRRTCRQRARPRAARVDAMAAGWDEKRWVEPLWTMDWEWDSLGFSEIYRDLMGSNEI